jgi:hypothetical protein
MRGVGPKLGVEVAEFAVRNDTDIGLTTSSRPLVSYDALDTRLIGCHESNNLKLGGTQA